MWSKPKSKSPFKFKGLSEARGRAVKRLWVVSGCERNVGRQRFVTISGWLIDVSSVVYVSHHDVCLSGGLVLRCCCSRQ